MCGTLKAGKYPRPSPCQPSADDPLPEKAASPPSAATAQSAEHRVHSHRRRACDPRNSGRLGARLRDLDRGDDAQPGRAQGDQQRHDLGRLRLQRSPARLRALVDHPPADRRGQHPRRRPQRHGRDRGLPLLQAPRCRLRRRHPRGDEEPREPQDRAGRIDDHAAARAGALHQGPDAQLQAQGARGEAGVGARGRASQALDPHVVPEQHPVRHGQRRDGRGHRGRGRDLLLQARQGPDARPGRAAGRPAAGALALQPVQEPPGCARPPQRGAARDGQEPLPHSGRGDRRDGQAARAPCRQQVLPPRRAVLLRLRLGPLDREVRLEHVPQGRAQGVHDDRPVAAAGRAPDDRERAQPTR